MGEKPTVITAEIPAKTVPRLCVNKFIPELPLLPFPYIDIPKGEWKIKGQFFQTKAFSGNDDDPWEIYTVEGLGNIIRASKEALNHGSNKKQRRDLWAVIKRCSFAMTKLEDGDLAKTLIKEPGYFYTRFYPSETS